MPRDNKKHNKPNRKDDARQRNINFYKTISKNYSNEFLHEFSARAGKALLKRFERITKEKMPLSGKILDLGCGDGYISLNIMQTKKDCVFFGMDLSLDMLKVCKKHAFENQNNIKLTAGDVFHLPFKNESFDGVIAQDILHHIPDTSQCFKEIHRILKSFGFFIDFQEPTLEGDKYYQKLLGLIMRIPLQLNDFSKKYRGRTLFGKKIDNINAELEGKDGGPPIKETYFLSHDSLATTARENNFTVVGLYGFDLLGNIFDAILRSVISRFSIAKKTFVFFITLIRSMLFITDVLLLRVLLPRRFMYRVLIYLRKNPKDRFIV